ncbi:MAG: acyl carrier protein [Bacteroidota bacterium]|nr:acyl carrier protein [Bacteroidota bacterium]
MKQDITETDDITTKVKEILSNKLAVELSVLNNNPSFTNDLGADSLDVMETFAEIEKEFNITISDEDAEKLKTVNSLLDFINKQKSG